MKIKRRHFIPVAGSALAAVLAACGGGASSAVASTGNQHQPSTGDSSASPGGSAIVLSGPNAGLEKSLSGIFTVTYAGKLASKVKVTPSDGAGGQFWSTSIEDDGKGFVYLSPSAHTATFIYAPTAAGPRTIALDNDGGLLNPAGIAYNALAAVPGSATPFRLVRAGITVGSYPTLQRCKDVGLWQAGDVIKCTSGTYVVFNVDDPGSTQLTNNTGGVQMGVEINSLTIEWETPGNPMVLDYSKYCQIGMWTGGQPRLLIMGAGCRSLTVRGIHFRGARPQLGASFFGAAIWTQVTGKDQPATLTVEYCKVWECPDGIKTQDAHYNLSTYIRNCVFENNSDSRGLDHDIYTGTNALTYVLGCTFRKIAGTAYPQDGMGHFVKSRCRATTVLACLFDGYMDSNGYGGVSQTINAPNGGVVKIAGNVILYYGATQYRSAGNPLRYGDDQHTQTVDTNLDPALSEHSLIFAQNTVRMALGHAVDGNYKTVLAIFPSGVATTLLSGALAQIPVIATVRNNIVASDTPAMTTFLANYPDNTQMQLYEISDTGEITGGVVAGSPSFNDAPYEWGGDFLIPHPREDTNRGGRTTYMPGWVPKSAWQWVNVGTNSLWTNYIKDEGSGIVPALLPDEPSYQKSYTAQWDYSSPAYSRKNHEIWMFGGGHQATTINLVSKWSLHKEMPDVSVACAATPQAIRKANMLAFAKAESDSKVYFQDGKPYAPHSYTNNQYSDATDEFISFGLAGMMSPGTNFDGAGGGWSSNAIAALQRNGIWRADGYYPPSTASNEAEFKPSYGPRFLSADGMSIYYWLNSNAGNGLYQFSLATRTHRSVGGGLPQSGARHCDEGNGRALVLGSGNSGGEWLAKFVNLSTGVFTSLTVSGDALPAGRGIYDLTWCADKGYYVSVWFNSTAMYVADADISGITVATITPTGASTAVASVKTMTGDGPAKFKAFRGAFYDPAYGCVIVVTHHSLPVKAFRIG